MSPRHALKWIDLLAEYPCISTDPDIVKLGAAVSLRYQISYWDGAILAATEVLGANIVYSEDLGHGQAFGPVRVVNPFLPTA